MVGHSMRIFLWFFVTISVVYNFSAFGNIQSADALDPNFIKVSKTSDGFNFQLCVKADPSHCNTPIGGKAFSAKELHDKLMAIMATTPGKSVGELGSLGAIWGAEKVAGIPTMGEQIQRAIWVNLMIEGIEKDVNIQDAAKTMKTLENPKSVKELATTLNYVLKTNTLTEALRPGNIVGSPIEDKPSIYARVRRYIEEKLGYDSPKGSQSGLAQEAK